MTFIYNFIPLAEVIQVSQVHRILFIISFGNDLESHERFSFGNFEFRLK